ncbi:hypothetical protein [Hymenobacter perfusus]|nr:hypothetical protein [Hymenobacter perfusus]
MVFPLISPKAEQWKEALVYANFSKGQWGKKVEQKEQKDIKYRAKR